MAFTMRGRAVEHRLLDGHHIPRVGGRQVERREDQSGGTGHLRSRAGKNHQAETRAQHDQAMDQAANDRLVSLGRVERSAFERARVRAKLAPGSALAR